MDRKIRREVGRGEREEGKGRGCYRFAQGPARGKADSDFRTDFDHVTLDVQYSKCHMIEVCTLQVWYV